MSSFKQKLEEYERYREVVLGLLAAIPLHSSMTGKEAVNEVFHLANQVHRRLEEMRPVEFFDLA